MREVLDAVLSFINEATLTDAEWVKADALLPGEVTELDEYKALLSDLQDRGGQGNATDKLGNYYKAKGVDISSVKGTGYSNIIGIIPLE